MGETLFQCELIWLVGLLLVPRVARDAVPVVVIRCTLPSFGNNGLEDTLKCGWQCKTISLDHNMKAIPTALHWQANSFIRSTRGSFISDDEVDD